MLPGHSFLCALCSFVVLVRKYRLVLRIASAGSLEPPAIMFLHAAQNWLVAITSWTGLVRFIKLKASWGRMAMWSCTGFTPVYINVCTPRIDLEIAQLARRTSFTRSFEIYNLCMNGYLVVITWVFWFWSCQSLQLEFSCRKSRVLTWFDIGKTASITMDVHLSRSECTPQLTLENNSHLPHCSPST